MTFKEWRKKELILQKELAEILGCHAATISLWERGLVEPAIKYRKIFKRHFGFDLVDEFEELKHTSEDKNNE